MIAQTRHTHALHSHSHSHSRTEHYAHTTPHTKSSARINVVEISSIKSVKKNSCAIEFHTSEWNYSRPRAGLIAEERESVDEWERVAHLAFGGLCWDDCQRCCRRPSNFSRRKRALYTIAAGLDSRSCIHTHRVPSFLPFFLFSSLPPSLWVGFATS
jgi:hypothetical protein